MSSQLDVIEVVIFLCKIKSPARCFFEHLPGRWLVIQGWLEYIEFFGAPDSCPAIVDPQFDKNIFGMSTEGVNRYTQL